MVFAVYAALRQQGAAGLDRERGIDLREAEQQGQGYAGRDSQRLPDARRGRQWQVRGEAGGVGGAGLVGTRDAALLAPVVLRVPGGGARGGAPRR